MFRNLGILKRIENGDSLDISVNISVVICFILTYDTSNKSGDPRLFDDVNAILLHPGINEAL